MVTEPQDPAKQGMHLQLTKESTCECILSNVNKGVYKTNVKGKRKMSLKIAQIYIFPVEESSCGIDHVLSRGQQLVLKKMGAKKINLWY